MAETTYSYTSLHEVSKRKEQVLKELRSEGNKMDKLRKQLTHKDKLMDPKSKSFNTATLLSVGAGILDVAAVAWRIYGKFKK